MLLLTGIGLSAAALVGSLPVLIAASAGVGALTAHAAVYNASAQVLTVNLVVGS